MYKCIELFSGNGDITKLLNKNPEISCESVDYNEEYPATYCENVYNLSRDFLSKYNFIWLSPDCTTYSFAGHGIHRRKGNVPVSPYAKYCDENNAKLFKLLIDLDIPFIAENPRAFFRQNDFVKGLYRCTVYSTYGAEYAKPTDLFSNRDISKYFNQSVKNTYKHLDYVQSNPKDFLGRCRIPEKLLNAIVTCIYDLLKKEVKK